jgi:hypothetical protein
MKRRAFITLLGGAAAWPSAARPQQPGKVPVLGFLHVGSAEALPYVVTSFRQGLKDTGYSVSKTADAPGECQG